MHGLVSPDHIKITFLETLPTHLKRKIIPMKYKLRCFGKVHKSEKLRYMHVNLYFLFIHDQVYKS